MAELRVLRLLPLSASFAEIGALLGLSPLVVRSRAITIYRKFGVVRRTEALEHARDVGLIKTDPHPGTP